MKPLTRDCESVSAPLAGSPSSGWLWARSRSVKHRKEMLRRDGVVYATAGNHNNLIACHLRYSTPEDTSACAWGLGIDHATRLHLDFKINNVIITNVGAQTRGLKQPACCRRQGENLGHARIWLIGSRRLRQGTASSLHGWFARPAALFEQWAQQKLTS